MSFGLALFFAPKNNEGHWKGISEVHAQGCISESLSNVGPRQVTMASSLQSEEAAALLYLDKSLSAAG